MFGLCIAIRTTRLFSRLPRSLLSSQNAVEDILEFLSRLSYKSSNSVGDQLTTYRAEDKYSYPVDWIPSMCFNARMWACTEPNQINYFMKYRTSYRTSRVKSSLFLWSWLRIYLYLSSATCFDKVVIMFSTIFKAPIDYCFLVICSSSFVFLTAQL